MRARVLARPARARERIGGSARWISAPGCCTSACGEGSIPSRKPLALGAGALLIGVLALSGSSRSLSKVVGAVVGLGIIGYIIRDWTSLASVVQEKAPSSFEVSSDIGFYLTIAGGALVLLSALMPSQTDKDPSA